MDREDEAEVSWAGVVQVEAVEWETEEAWGSCIVYIVQDQELLFQNKSAELTQNRY